MRDFRLKVLVRNNALLECIESAGYTMGPGFAKQAGVAYHALGRLVSLRDSPFGPDDEWRPIVHKLSEFLGVTPSEMFHTCHVQPLVKNMVERKADAQEIYDLLNAPEPDDPTRLLEHRDSSAAIDRELGTLTPKEREIIERHVMGGETLDEIAEAFGVSRERIRQQEALALRKLRHPSRLLRPFLDDNDGIPDAGPQPVVNLSAEWAEQEREVQAYKAQLSK